MNNPPNPSASRRPRVPLRARLTALTALVVLCGTIVFVTTTSASSIGRLIFARRADTAQSAARPTLRAPQADTARALARRTAALAPTEQQDAQRTAFVSTDQTDYQPGETVVIVGSGWLPRETVSLTLHEESGAHADTSLTAEADEYGNILNKEFALTEEHRGASFTLTATGQSSARTATAKFTDGGIMSYAPNSISLTAYSGPSGSTAVGFTQNITAPGGNNSFQANAQISSVSLGMGATAMPTSWVSVSPNSRNFATGPANNAHTDTKSWNVTVTPPANTAPGLYTAVILAAPQGAPTVGIGQGTSVFVTVSADNAPPTTTLTATANGNPYNGVNFTNAPQVTITLSATDGGGSGVAVTRYKIDNGPFQNYSGPFNINPEGLRVITYFSIDNTNAQETAQFFTVKIDRTAPAINCGSADGQWHAADVQIPCTAVDGGAQQKAGLANAGDASFSLTTNVSAGTEDANAATDSHQVCDNAGNCSTAGPVAGNMIDKKAPLTSCDSADGLWHAADVSIACTSTDGGSGLADAADASFSLVTNTAAGTENNNVSTDSHQVCDGVGNCATAGPVAGNMIDKKAPAISCPSADGLWHGANVGLVCTATDGGSGVNGAANATLVTSVPAGTEDANAATDSHVFTDNVGNSATAGPITGNMIDRKAPTVNCGSADGVWHASDVSIPCTSADGGSGLGNAGDASFALTTNVPAGTETANAATNSRSVADAVGNTATAGPISGNMVDKKGPDITITVPASGGNYLLGSSVASAYTVSDGGSGVASSSPASGTSLSTATVGGKTFTVMATDNVGNSSTKSANYTVSYQPPGGACGGQGHTILQPISFDGSSVFKKGSTVPAKFRVYDVNCNSIGTPGVVTSFYLVGVGAADPNTVNEPVVSTTPDTAFRWDPTDRQWVFNVSTKNLNAGSKYFFRITLNDGSVIDFAFNLK